MNVYQEVSCDYQETIHHTSPFHRHTGYELYLFLAGDANFLTAKDGFLLQPGYLVPITPGTWHKAKTNSDALYKRAYINCSLNLVKELSTPQTDLAQCFTRQNLQKQSVIQLTESASQTFLQHIQTIQQGLSAGVYGNDLKIKIALTEILLLANQAPQISHNLVAAHLPSLITEMMLFIDIHLKEDLSLQRFSQAFFMNGNYLSRTFKKATGITLQEYIIDKRIEFAKELLGYGYSVEQAASETGFGNYYHFIRAFKQRVGCPPGVYKKERTVR